MLQKTTARIPSPIFILSIFRIWANRPIGYFILSNGEPKLIIRHVMIVSGFLPKCYKTHTCTGGQRERRGREGGWREAR